MQACWQKESKMWIKLQQRESTCNFLLERGVAYLEVYIKIFTYKMAI